MKKLALAILLCSPAFAALGVNTVFEINSDATANNVNGGGFNPRNANMATDLSCTSPTGTAPVCSSASYNFVAGDVGAWLFVQAGTNWNTNGAGNNGKGGGCWYNISSVASNAATVNATAAAAVCISDGAGGTGTNTASNCVTCWVTNSLQGVANSSYVSGTASGTWSVDYSQSTAAGLAYTDLVIGGTTTQYTSAAKPVGKNIIGNLISVNSGAGCTVQRNEVVSTVTTTATTDKTLGTGASTCSANLGGAVSLGSAVANNTDSTLFNLGAGTNGTGAMMFWAKNGTYTFGVQVNVTGACGTQAPCVIAGYNTIRGDKPSVTSGNQPIFISGGNITVIPAAWGLTHFTAYGTALEVINAGGQNVINDIKVVNTSTTAAQRGLYISGSTSFIFASEFVSYRGRAFFTDANQQHIYASWMHDSDVGLFDNGGAGNQLIGSLFTNNVTNQVNIAAGGAPHEISQNTFYGREAKQSTCLNFSTTTLLATVVNNIFYGCTTGIIQIDTNQQSYGDFNDFNNNTTDVTKWYKGPNDIAVNPTFTSVTERNCTGTCTGATNVLTDTGAGFNAIITNDVSYINILAGTGVSATGVYPIHAHTDTTLTLATPQGTAVTIGTSSAITYSITTGLNWAVTAAGVEGVGFPGTLGFSVGKLDLGAIQSTPAAAGTQHNSAFIQ